ncbi:MAG: TatD family hydrolase [Desulfuromonadaceae bacterium]|nr:TatD family hydrolase [Desulfuromonadaceae bacterium]
MIDFHCHIDLYPDPNKIIELCDKSGIYVLSVTTTPKAWAKTNALSKGHNRIRTALGLHPQIAHERLNELSLFDRLVSETKYIGEVGLDGSPELKQHLQAQLQAFEHILKSSSRAGGKIFSIHSRKAENLVLDTLASFPDAGVPVLHWFSGTKKQLQRAIDMGCWFSVGPAMIRSVSGKSLVQQMPKDRVLMESDGPFVKVFNRAALPTDTELVKKELGLIWSLTGKETDQILLNSFDTICKLGH